MIEQSCGGCAQTHDQGGAVKMRRERQQGEEEGKEIMERL